MQAALDASAALTDELAPGHPGEAAAARALVYRLRKLAEDGELDPEAGESVALELLGKLRQIAKADRLREQAKAARRKADSVLAQLSRMYGGDPDEWGGWGVPVPQDGLGDPAQVSVGASAQRGETAWSKRAAKTSSASGGRERVFSILEALRVIVDKPQVRQGRTHPYVSYRVVLHAVVQEPGQTKPCRVFLCCHRRFNDLKDLYERLRRETTCQLPELPPQKHWLFGGSSESFVEERRGKLVQLLAQLGSIPQALRSPALQDFFLKGAQYRPEAQGYN